MFKLNNNQVNEKLLQAYRIDRAYGCYTRNALEMEIWPVVAGRVKYAIFADIDDMHLANDRFGYAGVDRRIRRAISGREGDIVVARWYSGDEILFLVLDGLRAGDPAGYARRIQRKLQQAGLSATFGIVELRPHETRSPRRAANRAARLVQRAKKSGERVSIHVETNLAAGSAASTSTPSIVSVLAGPRHRDFVKGKLLNATSFLLALATLFVVLLFIHGIRTILYAHSDEWRIQQRLRAFVRREAE
jgi:GGDEF domain-containing protein